MTNESCDDKQTMAIVIKALADKVTALEEQRKTEGQRLAKELSCAIHKLPNSIQFNETRIGVTRVIEVLDPGSTRL